MTDEELRAGTLAALAVGRAAAMSAGVSYQDAEDCAALALARAWEGRAGLRSAGWLSWVRTTARNAARDCRRRSGPVMVGLYDLSPDDGQRDPRDLQEVIPDGLGGPERALYRAEEGRVVWEALERLTASHARAVRLVWLEGESYEKAARLLGVPVGTVRSRLARARVALARDLG